MPWPVLNSLKSCLHIYYYNIGSGSSTECISRPAVISAACLGVALFISLIGLVAVIILLIKSKTKGGTVLVNSIADKAQSRSTSATQSSSINTKKNVSYVVHSPRLSEL